MTSAQDLKLNFYSKYNRVREKQDIESLYALIVDTDEYINHFEQLIFTLNYSRTTENGEENSPIRQYHLDHKTRKNKEVSILPNLELDEKDNKFNEMEDKLKKLEKLERNFHEQLDKSEKEYRKKKQLKQSKRKEREYYRNQLINVIEHTSEQSQQSRQSHNQSIPYRENIITSQIIENQLPEDVDDYYMHDVEVKINDHESDYDVKETKRKLREILEIQRKRQKEVESVQENVEAGKTSSIVIERLHIMPKTNEQKHNIFSPDDKSKEKQVKNYCEVELSHSQSQNVLRNVRSYDKFEIQQRIAQAEQLQANYEDPRSDHEAGHLDYEQQHRNYANSHSIFEDTHQNYEDSHQNYESPNYEQHLDYQNPHEVEEQQSNSEQHYQKDGQSENGQEQAQNSQNYYSEYEHNDLIDPPITLTQQEGNYQGTAEDASEINEEIADRVVSIGDLSEQQSQPPHSAGYIRSPLFLSQANPRKTFQNEHQVQSIAESLDFHPLESSPDKNQSKSQIIYGDKEIKSRNDFADAGDKKTSFKKLMAQNRANLIPRLAISTILNQHINQALGDYRTNIQVAPTAVANLHESIISSQGSSFVKPGKVNFKSMLRQNKNKQTSRDKALPNKDPVKVQANKKLLLSFFDEN